MIKKLNLDNYSQDEIIYYLAGKAVMSSLLTESFEAVDLLEIDEKIIRAQRSASGYFSTARINNAVDFPDFSQCQQRELRTKIEKSFLTTAAGIWAKSIFLFNEENKVKSLNFDQIQVLAVESNANMLLALRAVLSRLQLKNINLYPEILEESFLDYEAFLYRQSFAIIKQNFVWRAIVEIAEQLKTNRVLGEEEIHQICAKQKNFLQLRQEITLFYSAK